MKKNLFVTTIFILLISFVSAQANRFGFNAGVTMANMTDKDGDQKIHGDFKFAPTVGIVLDVAMQKNGSFQPGLNFVQKGTQDLIITGLTTTKITNTISYLEVPLNVLFKIKSGNGCFRIGGGPSVALVLSGKTTRVTGTSTIQRDLLFGNAIEDDYKETDFGLNGVAGYEFNSGASICLNYTYGIGTLLVTAGDHKFFNRCFGLRFGYLLKGKTKGKK